MTKGNMELLNTGLLLWIAITLTMITVIGYNAYTNLELIRLPDFEKIEYTLSILEDQGLVGMINDALMYYNDINNWMNGYHEPRTEILKKFLNGTYHYYVDDV